MNEREDWDPLWADRANWRFGVIYFCRQDPRIVVPKRSRAMGWTMNFARPMALPVLALIIGLVAGSMRLAESFGLDPWARILLALGLLLLLIKALTYRSTPVGSTSAPVNRQTESELHDGAKASSAKGKRHD